MGRRLGSKDKKKRKINPTVAMQAATLIGGAALYGVDAYRRKKIGDRKKKIEEYLGILKHLDNNVFNKPNMRENYYKTVKDAGKDFQKFYKQVLTDTKRDGYMDLSDRKKMRSMLLRQYRQETGLENAVDAYKAARKHAQSGDLAGQSKAGQKVIKRQKDKLDALIKKTGDRRNTIIFNRELEPMNIANFARPKGAKDKQKRRRRNLIIGGSLLGGGSLVGLGGYAYTKQYINPKKTKVEPPITVDEAKTNVKKVYNQATVDRKVGRAVGAVDFEVKRGYVEGFLGRAGQAFKEEIPLVAQIPIQMGREARRKTNDAAKRVVQTVGSKIPKSPPSGTKAKLKKGISDLLAEGWKRDKIARKQAVRDTKLAAQKAWRIIRYGKNINM